MARIVTILCDGCGRALSSETRDDESQNFAHVLTRASELRWERTTIIPSHGERDYCPRCLETIRGACERMKETADERLPMPRIEGGGR